MASKKQVAVVSGKSVVGWADRVKAAAERQVKSVGFLGGGSNWVSFKGGVITVDGASAPAGKFNCVILGYMQERAYYEDEFDGAKPQAPDCYAYGNEDGEVPAAPHPTSKHKQSDGCKSCEWSQYGTAQRGKGQACRQSVRLALVPATEAGVEHDPYFARIPPTSIKAVKGWLEQLGDTPCFAAVTEIQVTPSPGNMFDVRLSVKSELPTAFQAGVIQHLDRIDSKLREPYPDLDDREKPKTKPAPKKRGKF